MGTSRMRISTGVAAAAALALTGCGGSADAGAAERVHETKAAYADFASWPATAPGSAALRGFHPFRAVYERHYRDVSGEPRRDRVIVSAEEVAWGAEAAILVSLTDAGSLDYTDTSARGQLRFFSREDGRLLLQVTPAPGTAKDYGVVRAEDGSVDMTTVRTATGETEHREMPEGAGGWGAPPHWIVASMPLSPGMTLRFDPVFAFASSRVFVAEPFRVIGQESVEVLGETRTVWVVEHPIGLDGPRVMRTWLVDRPPYVLGRQPLDADTGEEAEIGSMRLLAFQAFESGR